MSHHKTRIKSARVLSEVLNFGLCNTVPQAVKYLEEERKLNPQLASELGIKAIVSETSGEPIFFFPVHAKGKVKGYVQVDTSKPKKTRFSTIGDVNADGEFFGQSLPECKPHGKKKVIVTEGVWDWVAVTQAMREYSSSINSNYKTPVIAITLGTPSAADQVSSNIQYLQGFAEVIVAFDNDARQENESKEIVRGQDAAEQVSILLPNMRNILWCENDANDVYREHGYKEIADAYFNAHEYEPTSLVQFRADMMDWVMKPLEEGFRFSCIPKTDAMIHGMRSGELMVILAPSGVGKCLGEGTLVRMYDNSLKAVQFIKNGDLLMGVDGTPRTVKGVTSGVDELYRVNQSNGISYVVNSAHILSTKACKSDGAVRKGDVLNENVVEYKDSTKNHKNIFKGYRVPSLASGSESIKHPYLLGLWVADGNQDAPKVWVNDNDKEIIDYLNNQFEVGHVTEGRGCKGYYLLNVKDYLPCDTQKREWHYEKLSYEDRCQLLAGILDGDGSVSNGSIEIIQKHSYVADKITGLANTLGFHVYRAKKVVNGVIYHRMRLTGDFTQIPFKLKRKIPVSHTETTLSRLTINNVGKGNYYGFELEGADKLFLLEDGTVTHNTTLAKNLAYDVLTNSDEQVGFVFLEEDMQKAVQSYVSIREGVALPRLRENPDLIPKEKQQEFGQWLHQKKAWFIDHEGSLDIEKMMTTFRHLHIKGCTTVIFDHFHMVLSADKKSNNMVKLIDNVLAEMAAFTTQTGMKIISVAHIKRVEKPRPTKAGEEPEPYFLQVRKEDARGSAAFEQYADIILCLEPEIRPDGERGTTRIVVDKNREWSTLGIGDYLRQDEMTGRYHTVKHEY